MPRPNMSTAMLAAIAANILQCAFFVEANFVTGPAYMWTGFGPITWNGYTWLGVGTLGSISVIDEGSTVEAKGITLMLSGFDSALLADVVGEFALGLPVTVWLGLFTGGALIANPVTSWAGRMDIPTIVADGNKATIAINCESRLLDMNTAVDRRYTQEDQQRDWPGDLAFNFVNAIQEMTLYVGTAPTSGGTI